MVYHTLPGLPSRPASGKAVHMLSLSTLPVLSSHLPVAEQCTRLVYPTTQNKQKQMNTSKTKNSRKTVGVQIEQQPLGAPCIGHWSPGAAAGPGCPNDHLTKVVRASLLLFRLKAWKLAACMLHGKTMRSMEQQ